MLDDHYLNKHHYFKSKHMSTDPEYIPASITLITHRSYEECLRMLQEHIGKEHVAVYLSSADVIGIVQDDRLRIRINDRQARITFRARIHVHNQGTILSGVFDDPKNMKEAGRIVGAVCLLPLLATLTYSFISHEVPFLGILIAISSIIFGSIMYFTLASVPKTVQQERKRILEFLSRIIQTRIEEKGSIPSAF